MAESFALPRIAFTIGDVNGVGPEVLVKALARPDVRALCRAEIVGSARLLHEYLTRLPLLNARVSGAALTLDDGTTIPIHEIASGATLRLGAVDASAGQLAGRAIEHAADLCIRNAVDAMVTMPISKSALHTGGYDFPGHTEMIAAITGGEPLMILMTGNVRVALVTIHTPLASVSARITPTLLETRVRQFAESLRRDFTIPSPRIAVLGLNPHAGEDGEIGTEEIETIAPTLTRLRADGLRLDGPLPADGFFARFTPGDYDGILAMYHDQGLIPLKLLARSGGVNVTAGLPIVRTSPDHGTAFAIAGRGIADETSVVEAVSVAAEIVRNRLSNYEC